MGWQSQVNVMMSLQLSQRSQLRPFTKEARRTDDSHAYITMAADYEASGLERISMAGNLLLDDMDNKWAPAVMFYGRNSGNFSECKKIDSASLLLLVGFQAAIAVRSPP